MNHMASPNRVVSAANGIDYAYREVGEGTPPLVLLQHFHGNLDNWDPALVGSARVAAPRHHVRQRRRRGSTGARRALSRGWGLTPEFLTPWVSKRVDLLGFSIGSFVAQEIALTRPLVVRKAGPGLSRPQKGRRRDARLGPR